MLIDLCICKPYHFKIISFQSFRAEFVPLSAFIRKVLRSVNFNYQLGAVAIEISDKSINGFLALKTNFIMA